MGDSDVLEESEELTDLSGRPAPRLKPTSHSSFTAGESGFEVLNREDVTARSNGWPLTPPLSGLMRSVLTASLKSGITSRPQRGT